MEIRSVLVNVGLGSSHAAVGYAARLAEAYGAELIGLAAGQPGLVYTGASGAQLAVDYYAAERKNIEERLDYAETRFRALVPAGVPMQWRSYVASTTEMLVDQARRADLVVVATTDVAEPVEMLDAGHLVLSCGRPVIVVGGGPRGFCLTRIVIAWKDTREARRAVWDALPLLKAAGRVVVAEIDEAAHTRAAAARVADVVAWLGRHGVAASGATPTPSGDTVRQLDQIARDQGTDLIVAGAYGHARFREWILGGVTRDLIMRSPRCSLMAH